MKTPQKPTSTSKSAKTTVWTIGHSNRSQKTFLEMLKEHEIEVLVDVRRFPTSKIEHFKREPMKEWLSKQGIEYVWLGEKLGGYRHGGYEAYMETKPFKEGIKRLSEMARLKRTCIMCMEPNPKNCHRRFISAYLENESFLVLHIIAKGQTSLLKFKIQNA